MAIAVGGYGPVFLSIIGVLIVVIASWLLNTVKYRQVYSKLHGSLNAPPFSMWFGSIPLYPGIFEKCPSDIHAGIVDVSIHRKYNLGAFFFLDNWPVSPWRQIVVIDPEIAAQATQIYSLRKHPIYNGYVGHICGKNSMLYAEGAEWKRLRGLFNPGFSAAHLKTCVPTIIDDVLILHKILDGLATSGKVVPVEEVLSRTTVDIMGHLILDHDLNSQIGENELMSAFRSAVHHTPHPIATNPLLNVNPVSLFKRWYYARRMDNYIKKVIQDRIVSQASISESLRASKSRHRPIIDLAVDEYLLENSAAKERRKVDEAFQQLAIDQIKTFMFAGHDTSSSTLAFVYYSLDRNPEALAKVRKEYDDTFGTEGNTAQLIAKNPELLNRLHYTTAVIKETLRLYPAASTTRAGEDGFSFNHGGKSYPTTKDMMISINHFGIHRREDYFPSPDEFIPERFLPAPNSWQEIKKDSWRPFEKGPRACIGVELAMLEMKIIMVLTLRDFDISGAYEEWDRSLGRERPGEMLDGKRGMWGHRAYQVLKVTAKPVDGLPVKVRRRKVA